MGLKITTAKLITNDADRLAYVREQKKLFEKEEKELLAKLDIVIGDNEGLKTDNLLIMKKPCQRTSLDKKALIEKVGESVVNECSKVSRYFQYQITRIQA